MYTATPKLLNNAGLQKKLPEKTTVAISTKITYEKVENLFLDPNNPRLGRENTGPKTTQARVLELMDGWNLEELAVSFLESGFWPQEALLVVVEELYGKKCLVVVEGNRRLAALKLLQDALTDNHPSKKWQELATGLKPDNPLFQEVPVLTADSRKDIEAFLGFRHVTGIMEWNPAEKAEYIARLVDQGCSYEEVRRKIGSKTETVRRNYISYRLLLQMEDLEGISVKNVEDRFSVLFLSLRTSGAQKYLEIDINADPKQAARPVPKDRLDALVYFARWLFGNEKENIEPIVRDSRQVDDFGAILESKEAIAYLQRTKSPSFDFAYRLAGGDEIQTVKLLEGAADSVETALSRVHLHKNSPPVKKVVDRLSAGVVALLKNFPDPRKMVVESLKQ